MLRQPWLHAVEVGMREGERIDEAEGALVRGGLNIGDHNGPAFDRGQGGWQELQTDFQLSRVNGPIKCALEVVNYFTVGSRTPEPPRLRECEPIRRRENFGGPPSVESKSANCLNDRRCSDVRICP